MSATRSRPPRAKARPAPELTDEQIRWSHALRDAVIAQLRALDARIAALEAEGKSTEQIIVAIRGERGRQDAA